LGRRRGLRGGGHVAGGGLGHRRGVGRCRRRGGGRRDRGRRARCRRRRRLHGRHVVLRVGRPAPHHGDRENRSSYCDAVPIHVVASPSSGLFAAVFASVQIISCPAAIGPWTNSR